MMNHKILLPLGIDDFREVIESGYYFVDKSLLIRDIIDEAAKIILLPRPRRFGKTLNLSMLYYYFTANTQEKDRNLFADLYITQAGPNYTSHQGQYPVIFFTLKAIKDASYEQAYQSIMLLIADLYRKHRYLLESEHLDPEEKQIFQQIKARTATETDVKNSLKHLIGYLHRHHGIKPILLLDEYDSPIHTAYDCGYYDEMVRFMQVFLGEAFKGNIHLHKAVITGILRVAQASIFSGLNNVMVYSLLSEEFSRYFGFLEEEVKQLNKACGETHTMAAIREWYNGYQFGQQRLYNPWSILNGLHFKKPLQAYWVNVANNNLIKRLISNAQTDVKSQFESLLQGQAIVQTITEDMVFPELGEKEKALWNLLLFTGYLTVVSVDLAVSRDNSTLRIPNREVQLLFQTMVEDWFSTRRLNLKNYDVLLQSLLQQNIPEFERLLQAYICESGSYFDFNLHTPEQVYHALVLGLVVGLRDQFFIQSNRESGKGRFDVCLFPKKPKQVGILLEFKQTDQVDQLEQTAAAALTQIMDQRYDTIFRQSGAQQLLCLGIAFAARDVKIAMTLLTI